MEDFDVWKIYAKLDDIEKDLDPNNQLRRYVELRRDIERFLLRTTGSL